MPRDIYVYKITCTMTSQICISQSIDPNRRYKQHKSKTPSHMKFDIEKYKPIEDFFKINVLYKFTNKNECDAIELDTIITLQTLGKHGYNITRGNPCKDSKRSRH